MSIEAKTGWKIRVKRGEIEIEVAGMVPTKTKEWFDELQKKHLGR